MKADNLEDIYELSPTQQGMLFHTLYAPESGVYFEQVHCTLQGGLNIPAFQNAWQRVVNQHPVLRTTFYWEDLETPMQVVLRRVELSWRLLDWRGLSTGEQQGRLKDYLQADCAQGIDFAQAQLMRLALIWVEEDSYHLLWSYHHLLLDGWSLFLVLEEVFAYYEAYCRGQNFQPNYRRPYRDYIAWLQEQDLPQAEAFWRQTLAGISSPTALGVGRGLEEVSKQKQEYNGLHISLSKEMTDSLRSLARQQQLTLNTLIQGAWALLLSRYSGHEDVVFGATISGRPAALPGVESMIGLFINTLPVRVQMFSSIPLLPWLQQLQAQQAEMRQYEYSPLVQVQSWSDVPGGTPLFDSIVVFENYPVNSSLQRPQSSLQVGPIRAIERTNYPLTLAVAPGPELILQLNYDSRRFSEDTIRRMLGHVQTLLEGFVAHPERSLAEVTLLSETEYQQLVITWNADRAEYDHDMSLHRLFEAQVGRTPDAVAVVFEDNLLTYRELNRRANQLAHYLQMLGVRPELPVGICLERSLELIVALLGTLKAGGAYVPLDAGYPQERLAFMLADANASVLLTQQRLLSALPEQMTRYLCLDTDWETIEQQHEENPESGTCGENLAYVIYTSGSTGRPKGVMVSHRAICNHMLWMKGFLPLTQCDRVFQKTPVSFDASIWEFYAPLLTGAQLVIAQPGGHQDSKYLVEAINRLSITVLQVVPSLLQLLLDEPGCERCNSLRYVCCGGEELPIALQQRFYTHLNAALYNLYGPTEATVDTICWACKPDSTGQKVPIGRPIANTQVYLLDQHLQPAPIGVAGELYIGGDALARGYLQRAALTAEQFLPNPFGPESGTRLYRTGDLARYRPDGAVEFLGRRDGQVKLRGYRIEIGEIEEILSQHPAVQQCVIVVREDIPGDQRLVAYIVPHEGQAPTISSLRNVLQAKLPLYMVPSTFVMQVSLPRTPSGKIDRRALPAPENPHLELDVSYVAPQSELEQTIAAAWQEALQIEKVGIHDNFFDLGGHSLLLIRVQSILRAALNKDITLIDMFRYTTVNSLARYLSQEQDEQSSFQQTYERAETRRVAMQQQRRHRRQVTREQQGANNG